MSKYKVYKIKLGISIIWGFLNNTLRLLDIDKMIMANSAPRASLSVYHLMSNARSLNNCQLYFIS